MEQQQTLRGRKRPRRRLRDLERDAARRTLNGNGMNGSLPPLPVSDDGGDENIDEGELGVCFGHPYGALPYGNIHLASAPQSLSGGQGNWHPDIVRHRGLGPLLRILNDEQVLSILSYVDGPTLAGGVVLSSRFLYVAGHHEELWRDLVFRRWGEVGFTVPPPPIKDEGDGCSTKQNCGCWKDVYAYNHYQWRSQNSISSPAPTLQHAPT